jgi:hypothetical protein
MVNDCICGQGFGMNLSCPQHGVSRGPAPPEPDPPDWPALDPTIHAFRDAWGSGYAYAERTATFEDVERAFLEYLADYPKVFDEWRAARGGSPADEDLAERLGDKLYAEYDLRLSNDQAADLIAFVRGGSPAGEPVADDPPLQSMFNQLASYRRIIAEVRAAADPTGPREPEPCVHCVDGVMGVADDACYRCYSIAKEQVIVLQEQLDALSGGSAGAATEAALRRVLVHLVSACDYVMPYVRGEPTPHRSQPQGSAAKQFARKVESLRAGLGLSEADTWKEAMDGRFTSPQEAAEFTESTVRAALSEPRNVSPEPTNE